VAAWVAEKPFLWTKLVETTAKIDRIVDAGWAGGAPEEGAELGFGHPTNRIKDQSSAVLARTRNVFIVRPLQRISDFLYQN
jgi:hypothetical protein